MDQTLLDIAGAARFLLDSCDVTEPMVDINAIAESWGLPVFEGMRSRLHPEHIEVDHRGSLARRRFDAGHELGHVIARHCGMDPTCERTASGIASATLMPDTAWKRDLARSEWDLPELATLYGVSLAVAVRRVIETRASIVSAWAGERLAGRWRSPWLSSCAFSMNEVPAWESGLAAACSRDVYNLRKDSARAWWSPSWVWVVTPAEEWESAYSSICAPDHSPPSTKCTAVTTMSPRVAVALS